MSTGDSLVAQSLVDQTIMKPSIHRSLWLVTVAFILSACVLVEDFQGYGPVDEPSKCAGIPCVGMGGAGGSTNASSGQIDQVSSSSSAESSSGSGGTSLASSSSSSGAGGNPSSSSSSSSSTSSGQTGTPGSVSCAGIDCNVSQETYGCCYVDSVTMICMSQPDCMLRPIFYCDGREDCGGSTCCFSNGEAICNDICIGGTILCLDDADCPPGGVCGANFFVDIGQCFQ